MDERVSEYRDSHASSSHEPSLELQQRTKITRATCRRRTGEVVPRAENFGDLITADHKVLGGGSESRNNHRYAVVAPALATQWSQSYPCKTRTSQESERSLLKFLEPSRKPKIISNDNSLEFGKACEDFSWNHCTSTLTIQKRMGWLREQDAKLKKGHLLYCCKQVRMKIGGRIPWGATAIRETYKIACLMGKQRSKGD